MSLARMMRLKQTAFFTFKLIPRGSNHHPKNMGNRHLRTISADFVEETRVLRMLRGECGRVYGRKNENLCHLTVPTTLTSF